MHKDPIVTLNHQHLKVLFHEISPDFLKSQLQQGQSLSGTPSLSVNYCSPQVYHRFAMDRDPCFSDTEVRNMGVDLSQKLQKEGSIFHFLLSQSKEMLSIQENHPFCRFDYILAWRNISKLLGQDLFTTSFLASFDLEHGIQRTDFCWKPVLSTDHKALNHLLAKGISEHHFHLNGSVPVHTLSWVYLMNHPRKINGIFQHSGVHFSEDLLGKNQEEGGIWHEKMKQQVWQAVALRGKLFQGFLCEEDVSFSLEPITAISQNQWKQEIEMLRYVGGFPFLQINGKECILDYAFHRGLGAFHQHQNRIFAGERHLQYHYFQKIFSGKATYLEEHVFYYYLLLQNSFYSQLVQVNQRLGFENFSKYQDRKDMFFSEDLPYDREAKRVGIYGAFQDQNILSLEARVTFKDRAKALNQAIKRIDRVYQVSETQRTAKTDFPLYEARKKDRFSSLLGEEAHHYPYYYVLHFIKKADQDEPIEETSFQRAKPRNAKADQDKPIEEASFQRAKPRNASTRKEIYKQARAFQRVMEKYPRLRGRIRGIDACSQEIGCRPEVFATEFRYLRDNSKVAFPTAPWISQAVRDIHVTFHAGEDFLDLLDGLRAIDETVQFLEYTRGDRLGHALALGVLPEDYYKMKQYRVILPKQDLLDNLVWFSFRSLEYDLTFPRNMWEVLAMEGRKLLYELYDSKEVSSSDLEHYYHSMKLRGDHPDVCQGDDNLKSFSGVAGYDKCLRQRNPNLARLREFPRVCDFLQRYHYDRKVRNQGNLLTTWEIPPDWIPYITMLQEKIQLDLTHKEISIECNPSSNVLIGTGSDYDKHPVFRFYNLGLENRNPQFPERTMDVSLNTDDLGVFATSLENEYGMIACTLQKMEISGERMAPHDIFQYLERLREMGNQQSFQKP